MDMKFNNCLIISKEDFFPMLRVVVFLIIYKSRFNWNETIYSTMCGLKFVRLYNGATLNY